ncbi:hypothetical protein PCE1_004440 [Barthelona sp. PCE]
MTTITLDNMVSDLQAVLGEFDTTKRTYPGSTQARMLLMIYKRIIKLVGCSFHDVFRDYMGSSVRVKTKSARFNRSQSLGALTCTGFDIPQQQKPKQKRSKSRPKAEEPIPRPLTVARGIQARPLVVSKGSGTVNYDVRESSVQAACDSFPKATQFYKDVNDAAVFCDMLPAPPQVDVEGIREQVLLLQNRANELQLMNTQLDRLYKCDVEALRKCRARNDALESELEEYGLVAIDLKGEIARLNKKLSLYESNGNVRLQSIQDRNNHTARMAQLQKTHETETKVIRSRLRATELERDFLKDQVMKLTQLE